MEVTVRLSLEDYWLPRREGGKGTHVAVECSKEPTVDDWSKAFADSAKAKTETVLSRFVEHLIDYRGNVLNLWMVRRLATEAGYNPSTWVAYIQKMERYGYTCVTKRDRGLYELPARREDRLALRRWKST